jgi:hypothetical protein
VDRRTLKGPHGMQVYGQSVCVCLYIFLRMLAGGGPGETLGRVDPSKSVLETSTKGSTDLDACYALGFPSKSPISLSQAGFMLLQWPHQGAWNLMKALLPATASSQFALVNSMAPATPKRDLLRTLPPGAR